MILTRPLMRPFFDLVVICIATSFSSLRADFVPKAYYLDYQFNVPTDILTSHSEAIVHPSTHVDVEAARAAGTTVYAYISVGELGKDAPHRAEALALGLPLRGQNPIWESDLLDLRDGRWADFLVNTVAKSAADTGFTGFFLDTLDSVENGTTSAEEQEQRAALILLIKQLKSTFPELPIIVNRGFETLSELAGVADGLLVESVWAAYDFEEEFYRPEAANLTEILLREMENAVELGYEVYVLDYADPADPEAALAAANRILAAGYHAFVSTPELDGQSLGPWQPAPPLFSAHPQGIVLRPGQSSTLSVSISGEPSPSITWIQNGEVLSGETAESLELNSVTDSNSGNYRVRITNRYGSVESEIAEVRVSETAELGRLTNLSARAWSGMSSSQLIPGVVSEGSVQVLARAVGPTLSDYDVVDVLTDPTLTVVREGEASLFNDDWQDDNAASQLSQDAVSVGAFALREAGADAAIRFALNGAATLPVGGSGETGTSLVEVYAMESDTATGVLTNLSTRAEIRPVEGALIVGFVLAGDTPSQILIRGVGPSLSAYEIEGVLADPQIQVVRDTATLAQNDDWMTPLSQASRIRAAASEVGAFALDENSTDSALLLSLVPGVYTATVSGGNGSSGGVVLAEIYLLQ